MKVEEVRKNNDGVNELRGIKQSISVGPKKSWALHVKMDS